MNAISSDVLRLKRRQAIKSQKIDDSIDGLLTGTKEILDGIKGRPEKAASNGTPQKQATIGLNTQVRQQCEQLVNRKYLRKIQDVHKDYFTYVSKLGKSIDNEMFEQVNLPEFQFELGKRDLLELVDSHSASQPKKELKGEFQSGLHWTLSQIECAIKDRSFLQALDYSREAREEGHMLDESLHMELIKLNFLQLVKLRKVKEAALLLRKHFDRSKMAFTAEYGELMHVATLKDSTVLPHRLRHYNLDSVLDKCGSLVSREIRRSQGKPEVPPLQEIISAGIMALPQFVSNKACLKNMKKDTELSIPIPLPDSMIHHSVIYCPISKESCAEESNQALIQTCGHIVGEQSVKKMMESQRKRHESDYFKCPTCPNQQKPTTMRRVYY